MKTLHVHLIEISQVRGRVFIVSSLLSWKDCGVTQEVKPTGQGHTTASHEHTLPASLPSLLKKAKKDCLRANYPAFYSNIYISQMRWVVPQ